MNSENASDFEQQNLDSAFDKRAEQLCEMLRGDLARGDLDVSGNSNSGAKAAFDETTLANVELLRPLFDLPDVEPPADLIDATLDRCLVILPKTADEAEDKHEVGVASQPKSERSAFRSSVEILTQMPMANSGRPASKRSLFLRLVSQAAAAVLLFACCASFWNVVQPAYAHARSSAIDSQVQAKLKRLHNAAMKYRLAVQNGELETFDKGQVLDGRELANRLITYGFAEKSDFLCPGVPESQFGGVHFCGRLSFREGDAKKPLFWDRFSNHGTHVNMVFHDGVVLSYSNHDFPKLFR